MYFCLNKITKRDENYNYVTGDSGVDKMLSLDNGVIWGNPSSNAQINFAALVYLSGLFGGKCVNFTVIPFGFLYEMDFNDERGLHLIAENEKKATNSNFLGFNLENLICQIKNFKNENDLNEN